MAKIRIPITLDAALLDELRASAQQDQRTLSNYINHALKQYLAQQRQSQTPVQRQD